MGGAIAAIERGFFQDEIHEAAFRLQQAVESGERAIVGVNRFEEPEERPVRIQRIDEDEVARQVERLRHVRGERDGTAVERALADVEAAARGTGNLLPPMREALRAAVTVGEVSDVLRRVFGVHRPTV
jgi:methylmalonyl-CoA mutase N-terminal domain/subunit